MNISIVLTHWVVKPFVLHFHVLRFQSTRGGYTTRENRLAHLTTIWKFTDNGVFRLSEPSQLVALVYLGPTSYKNRRPCCRRKPLSDAGHLCMKLAPNPRASQWIERTLNYRQT